MGTKNYLVIGRIAGTFRTDLGSFNIEKILDTGTNRIDKTKGRITVNDPKIQDYIENQKYFNKTVLPAPGGEILFKSAPTNNIINVPSKPIVINPLNLSPEDLDLIHAAIDADPSCKNIMRENLVSVAKDRTSSKAVNTETDKGNKAEKVKKAAKVKDTGKKNKTTKAAKVKKETAKKADDTNQPK